VGHPRYPYYDCEGIPLSNCEGLIPDSEGPLTERLERSVGHLRYPYYDSEGIPLSNCEGLIPESEGLLTERLEPLGGTPSLSILRL